jgi:diketogulonate reductase-like aldo/keto reductase
VATAAQLTVSGLSVPAFLYGTAWKEAATQHCVNAALAAGFRGIDTANQRRHYHEAGVGAALEEAYASGRIERKDLFLQSKFTFASGQDHRLPYDPRADYGTQVHQSFQSSLEHLRANYLDSYILHGPSSRSGLSDADLQAWGAMEELCKGGHTKLLGISNVSIEQLQELCERCHVRPSFVQNRCYADQGWDREIRRYCGSNGIQYQGFSLLTANPDVLNSPQTVETAARHRCTTAQLIFSFALRAGIIPLTGTTSPAHMQEDLKAFEFNLSAQEMDFIENCVL